MHWWQSGHKPATPGIVVFEMLRVPEKLEEQRLVCLKKTPGKKGSFHNGSMAPSVPICRFLSPKLGCNLESILESAKFLACFLAKNATAVAVSARFRAFPLLQHCGYSDFSCCTAHGLRAFCEGGTERKQAFTVYCKCFSNLFPVFNEQTSWACLLYASLWIPAALGEDRREKEHVECEEP